MSTWSIVSVLACAHLAASANLNNLPDKKQLLHEHPTLVKMVLRNNELRRQHGLSEHQVSPHLTLLAQKHAEWMAATGSFSHNYNHPYPEIIYWNARSITDAFHGWMNSGPHRGLILSGSTCVGYGFAIADNGQTYWCGVFGNVNDKVPVPVDGT
jgi:uncharacterized protein YkwD